MGENGAGKSTLIKALTGVYSCDEGTITVGGEQVSFHGPAQAQDAGISTVYQEVNLLPEPLGRREHHARPRAAPLRLDRRTRDARAAPRELLERPRPRHRPGSLLGDHSLAIQQLVAIARATNIDARVLILDEPTSSLDADEVAELFRVIRSLKESGVAILFVSHFLDQVYEIADRLTVLRNGRLVGEYLTEELLRIDLVQKMIGKEIATLEDLEQRVRESDRRRGRRVRVPAGPKDVGRKGAVESVRPGDPRGRGRRASPACSAPGAPRWPACSAASTAPTAAAEHRRQSASACARRARRSPGASRSRPRTAAPEGVVDELTVRDNIVLALQADRGWFRPIPKRAAGRARAELHPGAQHPPRQPRRAAAQPLGRQPAEGAARPVARDRTAAAHPRRADARHRHRREGRDPEARLQPRRERDGGASTSRPSSRRCCASATASS